MDFISQLRPWSSTNKGKQADTADVKASAGAGAPSSSSRPLLRAVDLEARQSFGPAPSLESYGQTFGYGATAVSMQRDASAGGNSNLGRVPEERDDEVEEDRLEERGLYSGSYPRLVTLYTLVPIGTFSLLVILAILPPLVWPLDSPPPGPHSHPPLLPSPFPELLLAASFWTLSHVLRSPLTFLLHFVHSPFSLLSYQEARSLVNPFLSASLSSLLYALYTNGLRLAALALLFHAYAFGGKGKASVHSDAFRTAWTFSISWALSESLASISQGYQQLALYRDVLVPPEEPEAGWLRRPFLGGDITDSPVDLVGSRRTWDADAARSGDAEEEVGWRRTVQDEAERDLEGLVALKARQELDEVYGIPFVRIPVFISFLQRVGAVLLSLALTLLLGGAYLRSAVSVSSSYPPPVQVPRTRDNLALEITVPCVVVLHGALALLHTPALLPRIGLHVAAYATLLAALGAVFAGLAVWGAVD